ncbi:hypothetical protein D3C77_438880 [compost metagenome]
MNAELVIHHCQGVVTHFAGADRVVLGVGAVANILLHRLAVLRVQGVERLAAKRRQWRVLKEAAKEIGTAHQYFHILCSAEKARVNQRCGARVLAGQLHRAAALGP